MESLPQIKFGWTAFGGWLDNQELTLEMLKKHKICQSGVEGKVHAEKVHLRLKSHQQIVILKPRDWN